MRLVVLFGSAATGRAHAGSDLDIAILPREPAPSLADEARLANELERELGRPIDLVRIDHASGVLRWQVASTGRLICADPPWEWTRFRAAVASEHADIAPAYERCTRLFLQRIARPR